MTGAYLRTKTAHGWESVEVEHLSPEERRRLLQDRDPVELMRWMDLLCDKLVEAESLILGIYREGSRE